MNMYKASGDTKKDDESKVNISNGHKAKRSQKPSGCPCDYGICDECDGQGCFNPRS